jgi:transcriptional regulator GlxA family with amidase domain
MSLAPLSVFEIANQKAGQDLYQIQILSEQGGNVPNSLGMNIFTQRMGAGDFDTILVGSASQIAPAGLLTLEFLRHSVGQCRRIASVCAGVFTLAESGVLDGRRATTHWAFSRELQERYPKITVEPDRIFVADGPFWTSAGMTAGIDLALGLVERDAGSDVARQIARELVVHHRRTGGQSQHSVMLELDAKSDRVQEVLAFAQAHLHEELTVDRLAEVARLSPRQFCRVFTLETGYPPARAIEKIRLEAARLMLEQGRLPLKEIAMSTGFGDDERMRRSFQRSFGQTPQALRISQRSPLAI